MILHLGTQPQTGQAGRDFTRTQRRASFAGWQRAGRGAILGARASCGALASLGRRRRLGT